MVANPQRHAFAPSRPDGTVCVAQRAAFNLLANGEQEEINIYCGYPRSHPIHGPLDIDLSPRAAPLRTDAEDLRVNLWALVEHARQAPPGAPALVARVDEIVQRWGSART